MAVYTALDRDALVEWLARHDVGALVEWRGIESGIENTNFFVTTRDACALRHFVLTLFERLGADQLPFYLGLMRHLATRGVPCPAPMAARDGSLGSMLAGKPAALVTRLDGRSIVEANAVHCAALGTALARLHEAGASFETRHDNPRGLDWWLSTARGIRDFLDESQRSLLDDEIEFQAASWNANTASLPRGPIHADLFRDNALFVGATDGDDEVELRGIIDLYFAGRDVWILDIAICINDWCVDLDTGALDASRKAALVDAYERERPLIAEEHDVLPQALRAAALRFWLSRLDDLHRPRPAQILTPHDPARFERLLRLRRDEALYAAVHDAGPGEEA